MHRRRPPSAARPPAAHALLSDPDAVSDDLLALPATPVRVHALADAMALPPAAPRGRWSSRRRRRRTESAALPSRRRSPCSAPASCSPASSALRLQLGAHRSLGKLGLLAAAIALAAQAQAGGCCRASPGRSRYRRGGARGDAARRRRSRRTDGRRPVRPVPDVGAAHRAVGGRARSSVLWVIAISVSTSASRSGGRDGLLRLRRTRGRRCSSSRWCRRSAARRLGVAAAAPRAVARRALGAQRARARRLRRAVRHRDGVRPRSRRHRVARQRAGARGARRARRRHGGNIHVPPARAARPADAHGRGRRGWRSSPWPRGAC